MPNRLADEASLYLRQHADNPVDWYPWGDDAFARAVAEDRPVLLSVGYSSCHWCHVMAHESFEDPATAELMNRLFVCVKVDREERPDIDALYMQATVAMSGHGGWPMTVILTPQGEPFFAGTYFPPTAVHGRPSFTDVLEHVSQAYATRRHDVTESAQRVVRALTQAGGPADHAVERSVVDDAVTGLAMSFDPDAGGFGGAPKFPPSVVLDFLLQRLRGRPDDVHVRRMVEQTLDAMAAGGIHDQVGGGFHRYSVDRVWLVPHFEKMLYDNALLALVFSRAYMVSGDPHRRHVAERTFTYLQREMQLTGGGFASSQDADSPGGEGAYFVWTQQELRRLLSAEEAHAVEARFGVTAQGNFEGANILHVVAPMESVEQAVGSDAPLLIASALGKLAHARATRPAPVRDEALIGAWNSLAAQAFATGAVAMGRDDLAQVAEQTVHTVMDRLYVNGRLHRSWAGGRANHLGVLEDYANLAQALIALHDATLRWAFVEQAIDICEQAIELFGDPSGAVQATGRDAPTLVAPVRDVEDHPAPGGSSQLALALARLADLTGRADFASRADRLLATVAESSRRAPQAFGTALAAIDWVTAPQRHQIAIVVAGGDPTPFIDAARAAGPYTSLVVGQAGSGAPLLDGRSALNGRTTAYVCTDMRCLAPVDDVSGLVDALASA